MSKRISDLDLVSNVTKNDVLLIQNSGIDSRTTVENLKTTVHTDTGNIVPDMTGASGYVSTKTLGSATKNYSAAYLKDLTVFGSITVNENDTTDIGSTGSFVNAIYAHELLMSPLAEADDFAKITASVSGENTLVHHQIGRDAGDKIIFEANNGTTVTTLLTVSGDGSVTIPGSLTVSGATTTINTQTLTVENNIIVLNNDYTGSSPSEDATIEVERGTVANAAIKWNETTDEWEAGVIGGVAPLLSASATKASGRFYTGTTAASNTTRLNYDGNLYATAFYGPITGNVTGDVTGNVSGSSGSCTGNAATATTASACSGNASTSSSCSGNASTATTATSANAVRSVNFHSDANAPTGTTQLNMDGYFYATRVYNAVYNDLAEFMAIDPQCPGFGAGQVFVMGENGIKVSAKRADKAVIGVCSDSYGFILGGTEGDAGKVPVGISGRVWVRVKEQVKIGDLLVSDVDGCASKATDEEARTPGIIIGKVLENKNTTDLSRVMMLIMNR